MKKLIVIAMVLASCRNEARPVDKSEAVATTQDSLYVTQTAATEEQFNVAWKQSKAAIKSALVFDSLQHKKAGSTLNLHLDNGSVINFTDNTGTPHDEDRLTNNYVGRETTLNKYIVAQKLYEGSRYLLIDKKSGIVDTLPGLPYSSPDGKVVFCAAYNPYEEYEHMPPPTQDIYFYTITNGLLKKIHGQPYKMFIDGQVWLDSQTLLVRYNPNDETNQDKTVIHYASFRIVGGQAAVKSTKAETTANKAFDATKWAGTYEISVDGEETTTGTSSTSYIFTIDQQGANLETVTTHEPISCNGKYRVEESDKILHLYYDGDDARCKKRPLPFDIKLTDGRYFIRGVGGEDVNRQWLALSHRTVRS